MMVLERRQALSVDRDGKVIAREGADLQCWAGWLTGWLDDC